MHVTDSLPAELPRRDADLAGWLRLQQTAGIGAVAARALLLRFGTPQAIFNAPFDALRAILNPAQAGALVAPDGVSLARELERILAWL